MMPTVVLGVGVSPSAATIKAVRMMALVQVWMLPDADSQAPQDIKYDY
jgi:hypothetical protein